MTNGLAFYDAAKAIIYPSYLLFYTDRGYIDLEVTDGVYTAEILDSFGNYQNGSNPKGSATAYVKIVGALTGTVNDVVIRVKRNGVWL